MCKVSSGSLPATISPGKKRLFEKESNVTLSLNFFVTFDCAASENTINVLGTLMSRGVMHVKETSSTSLWQRM